MAKSDPFETRLLDGIAATTNTIECWFWQGTLQSAGYGCLRNNYKRILAHRAIYELFTGEDIPAGMIIRHKCDTPNCVNPYHLEIGDYGDNQVDRFKRNRPNRGGGISKFTTGELWLIKRLRNKGITYAFIGKMFEVSWQYIQSICNEQRGINAKESI